MSEFIEAAAIEKFKPAEPGLSTATELAIPALFQERFIVRFAYGMNDRASADVASRVLNDHPDFFLTYEDADGWGKANCPPGMAYGITKLTARVSPAEIEKYEKLAAKAARKAKWEAEHPDD